MNKKRSRSFYFYECRYYSTCYYHVYIQELMCAITKLNIKKSKIPLNARKCVLRRLFYTYMP